MNLVINSKFRPFTYDEMVKPLGQYKEEYDKLSDDLSTLSSQVEAFKSMSLRADNPDTYEQYMNYMKDLTNASELLSEGLSPQLRKELLGLKQRYYSEIEPIKQAKEKYDKVEELRLNLQAQNPNVRFKNKLNIDSFLRGDAPDMDYINLDNEYKNAAVDFKNAAQAFLADTEKAKSVLGNQYYLYKGQGYTSKQMYDALNSTEEGKDVLTSIVKDYRNKVKDYGTNVQNEMEEVLHRAMLTGLASEEMKENKSLDHYAKSLSAQSANLELQLKKAELRGLGIINDKGEIDDKKYAEYAKSKKTRTNNDDVDKVPTGANPLLTDPDTGKTYSYKTEKKRTTSKLDGKPVYTDVHIFYEDGYVIPFDNLPDDVKELYEGLNSNQSSDKPNKKSTGLRD